jgi:nitrite reductase/ring-hydroxylating ferredoxin subunit
LSGIHFVDWAHGKWVPSNARVSRRTALLSTLGVLAGGVLAGFGLDRLGKGSSTEQESLVEPERGEWVDVAGIAEVPNGVIRRFTAGAVEGFLINREGTYRALSRLCTHMGCTLGFDRREQSFVCPCHGAVFGLNGRQRLGTNQFRLTLPRLPEISVRVHGDSIQVWAA